MQADRQCLLVKRAEIAGGRLQFIVEALQLLLRDENFVAPLRAENVETLPRPLRSSSPGTMADSATGPVRSAFEPAGASVALADVLPIRQVRAAVKASRKNRRIATPVREIGIARPPIVARHGRLTGTYLLLDGHLRIAVLKDLGVDRATCLVSIDDETFTYNRQVNRWRRSGSTG